jgi:hypothetical protein
MLCFAAATTRLQRVSLPADRCFGVQEKVANPQSNNPQSAIQQSAIANLQSANRQLPIASPQ